MDVAAVEQLPCRRSLAQPLSMADGDGAVIALEQGEVRGTLREGVARFLAIPYAAAPSGNQRWDSENLNRWGRNSDFQQMVEARIFNRYC